MTNQPKPDTLAERLRHESNWPYLPTEIAKLLREAADALEAKEAELQRCGDTWRSVKDHLMRELEAKDREIATLKEHIRVLSAPFTKG